MSKRKLQDTEFMKFKRWMAKAAYEKKKNEEELKRFKGKIKD